MIVSFILIANMYMHLFPLIDFRKGMQIIHASFKLLTLPYD